MKRPLRAAKHPSMIRVNSSRMRQFYAPRFRMHWLGILSLGLFCGTLNDLLQSEAASRLRRLWISVDVSTAGLDVLRGTTSAKSSGRLSRRTESPIGGSLSCRKLTLGYARPCRPEMILLVYTTAFSIRRQSIFAMRIGHANSDVGGRRSRSICGAHWPSCRKGNDGPLLATTLKREEKT